MKRNKQYFTVGLFQNPRAGTPRIFTILGLSRGRQANCTPGSKVPRMPPSAAIARRCACGSSPDRTSVTRGGGTRTLGKAQAVVVAAALDRCPLAASRGRPRSGWSGAGPQACHCSRTRCGRLLPSSLWETRGGPRSPEPEGQDFPCLSQSCLAGHPPAPCGILSFSGLPDLAKDMQIKDRMPNITWGILTLKRIRSVSQAQL